MAMWREVAAERSGKMMGGGKATRRVKGGVGWKRVGGEGKGVPRRNGRRRRAGRLWVEGWEANSRDGARDAAGRNSKLISYSAKKKLSLHLIRIRQHFLYQFSLQDRKYSASAFLKKRVSDFQNFSWAGPKMKKKKKSSASKSNRDGGTSFFTIGSFLVPVRPVSATVERYATGLGSRYTFAAPRTFDRRTARATMLRHVVNICRTGVKARYC